MLRLREMRSVLEKAKTQGVSMQRRLVLYWFSMALAILAAVLLVVSLTGVFSNTAQKFGQSLAIQKHNTASALAGQMDQLTAQSIALSEELTRELDKQLAAGGRTFSALNDDPGAIAAVETALYPALNTYLKSSACSGAVFCLDATANTALPGAATSRAGLYLRYSALRAIGATDQHITCFRGTAETARSTPGADAQPLESGAERSGRPRLHAAAARIGRPSRRALPVDGARHPARHMGVGDAAVRADARQRRQCARHLRRGAQRPVFSPHLSRRGQCLRQHGHGARPHRRATGCCSHRP